MPTGLDLITAIQNNAKLMSINNCPGVSARLGYAVYGNWQDDDGDIVLSFTDQQSTVASIKELVHIPDGTPLAHTAVWHFSVEPPIHHFVVIPWYRFNTEPGWVYTVFMAYESNNSQNKYTLGEYIQGGGNTAKDAGYRDIWTQKELSLMLYQLLASKSVWPKYFGGVDQHAPNKITCYKYPSITVDQAIQNVNSYNMA